MSNRSTTTVRMINGVKYSLQRVKGKGSQVCSECAFYEGKFACRIPKHRIKNKRNDCLDMANVNKVWKLQKSKAK